jgi:hypothetical protein
VSPKAALLILILGDEQLATAAQGLAKAARAMSLQMPEYTFSMAAEALNVFVRVARNSLGRSKTWLGSWTRAEIQNLETDPLPAIHNSWACPGSVDSRRLGLTQRGWGGVSPPR